MTRRRTKAFSLLTVALTIQLAASLKLEHHPDRIHEGRENLWTAADERQLRKQNRGVAKSAPSANGGNGKTGKSGKGKSYIPEPEFCRNCAFSSSYSVSSAVQVVNGQLLDFDQIFGAGPDSYLATCDSCGCNSETPGEHVVMSLEGECDRESGVDLLQVIVTNTNPASDGLIEMTCPDITYDIEVECRAFSLADQMEILPAPFTTVLHFGPTIAIEMQDRSANYFCNFMCTDAGVRQDTPVVAPPRPPPMPSPPLPTPTPPNPTPSNCMDETSDGTFLRPHLYLANPLAIPPNNPIGCVFGTSEQQAAADAFCQGIGGYVGPSTFLSASANLCSGAGQPAISGTGLFFRALTGGFPTSLPTTNMYNSNIVARCCFT